MIHLYIADVSMLPLPEECPALVNGLSPERQQRLQTLLKEEKQKQCLGAGLLLKKALVSYGISVDSVYIGKHGKPEVEGIHFNISHSGKYVICAVSDSPVGCDIEKRRKISPHLAERYFCTTEKVHLEPFDVEAYEQEFFRLWTKKESYVKMTGEGLATSMDTFDVLQKEGRDCFFEEYEVEGYQIAVCTEKEQRLKIETVDDIIFA